MDLAAQLPTSVRSSWVRQRRTTGRAIDGPRVGNRRMTGGNCPMKLSLAVLVAVAVSQAGADSKVGTEAGCSAPSLVATIAPAAIGEPVRSVSLQAAWVAAPDTVPAHCRVDGVFAPVDTAPTARPVNFRVILPASWNRRAAQLGGGGIN